MTSSYQHFLLLRSFPGHVGQLLSQSGWLSLDCFLGNEEADFSTSTVPNQLLDRLPSMQPTHPKSPHHRRPAIFLLTLKFSGLPLWLPLLALPGRFCKTAHFLPTHVQVPVNLQLNYIEVCNSLVRKKKR